jgi:very-short-patch-repair endonuclease
LPRSQGKEKEAIKILLVMNDENMHYGAEAFSFQTAESLRETETYPEKKLWEALKNKKLDGLKFRRQHPINRFVVDFYCHKYKLVIELDGSVHENEEVKARDIERENELKTYGLNILRFTNTEVISNFVGVLSKIREIVAELEPK